MDLNLNEIEKNVILFSLKMAIENELEENGIGSYGGDIARELIKRIENDKPNREMEMAIEIMELIKSVDPYAYDDVYFNEKYMETTDTMEIAENIRKGNVEEYIRCLEDVIEDGCDRETEMEIKKMINKLAN